MKTGNFLFFAMVCCIGESALLGQEPPGNPGRSLPNKLLESMMKLVDPHTPSGIQRLLLNAQVRSELEIDRDTFSLLSQAQSDLRKQSAELSRSMLSQEDRDPEAMRAYVEKSQELQAESEKLMAEALEEIFPPGTYARLKQIAYRIQIAEAGLRNVLLYGPMTEELDLSEAEWEKLAANADELEAEKQARIRKIVSEYEDRLLRELTLRQRKKFDELVGEPFKHVPQTMAEQSFEHIREARARYANAPKK